MRAEKKLLERVAQTIARYGMFEPCQKVGVAVSGGADSVCLLYVLRELAPRWGLRLSVLHVNHGLRGRASEEDAEFVRALSAGFDLPFAVREVNLAGVSENLEQAGREARLDFFSETIAGGNADRIAVGHTRSDQAETVLFRFLRGAGTAGLAGIRPVTSTGIVRPLLEIDRAEVEAFLRERNVVWREDATNSSPQFARNRIRHGLLPQLAAGWNPNLVATLANTAEWALAEESYWETEIDRLSAVHFLRRDDAILLQTDGLRVLPLAVARRLVRRALEAIKKDLRSVDFIHVAGVLDLAAGTEGHGRLQVPGVDVMRSFNWLRFAKPRENGLETRNYRVSAPVPGTVRVPLAGIEIRLELLEKTSGSESSDYVYNGQVRSLDWQRLSGPLELRNWRPGDQYKPFGKSSEEKIKNLFQEFRVPLWERRHWPVLIDGDSIVWARRFGPAADLVAGSDARILLTIRESGIALDHGGVYISERAG